MLTARQLDDDLWILDTLHQGEPGVIAVYLLVGPDGLALIDVGPAVTVPEVIAGIEDAGYKVTDLRHLVLTHIHLDHAGAAGALVQLVPQARVYVHPLGAHHLIDPTKLVASARRIYGVEMDRLWGTMTAVPAAQIQVLEDNDQIQVGGRILQAMHTPGHAVHHIAYHDASRHELFTGDVAGVALEGIDFVRPPTPPPDLNLEDWSQSLSSLSALELVRLFLPHFGPVTRVKEHFPELERRLYEWGDLVLAGMRVGKVTEAIVSDLSAVSEAELQRQMHSPDDGLSRRYELATNYRMTVEGYERYYRKQHPELLKS